MKDAETGSVPQGDATFNGAVYKVYANEDIYNKANPGLSPVTRNIL